MKTVAKMASEATTMRQRVAMPRVEQGWTSVLVGLFETVVVGGVDLVVGVGT